MITSISVPSHAQVEATQMYLAELRDRRLKRAGCTVEERVSFLERRVQLIRSEK